jgi:putative ABC transport system permease protein
VTATLTERPLTPVDRHRSGPARRAIIRWAWRLFRREWRQQVLVLILLIAAIAAMIVGLGVASNASNLKADPTFGTANTIITLPGSDPNLAADINAIANRFGPIDVIDHQNIAVPGSVSTIDLRAQNPEGPYGRVALRLDAGRFPTSTDEVAVTDGVANAFGLHINGTWSEGGRTRRVVGRVENPLDLSDQFALVPPGQANPPAQVSVLLDASQADLQSFRLPSGQGLSIGTRGAGTKTASEAIILVLGSLGLVFVGLMGVAGFTVMAHRRLRSLGMLGSLGATDRHIRLVMLANGGVVGATAAIIGALIGLGAWFAFVPTLQSIAGHRVDPFALPWWAIATAMILTFISAVAAAWWPARTVARIPVVAALSGRPPRPQPAHRFAALGGVLLGAGVILLAFADQNRVGFIITGTVTTAVGLLFLCPLAIRGLAAAGSRWPIAIRLAVRDLVRYQARSGAALGAVTMSIGIAATITISASAAQTTTGPGNLPANQLMLYLSPAGALSQIPSLSPTQQQTVAAAVDRLAGAIGARSVLPLEQAYDPTTLIQPAQPGSVGGGAQPAGYVTVSMARVSPNGQGEEITSPLPLYVATSQVLAYFGIKPADIAPTADILTSDRELAGLQVLSPEPGLPGRSPGIAHPRIQILKQLPAYTSAPVALITSQAVRTLGLQPLPAAWLIQSKQPLTPAQIATARRAAAQAGLYVETRTAPKSLAPLRNWSTAAGILLALGVLAMTVGLIRSETASDLRTLTATGASSFTRRSLTGATAGALALLGAVVGTAGAYAALLAWYRSGLQPLGRLPTTNLIIILVGFPAVASLAGWLLAGREPSAINRRPLE